MRGRGRARGCAAADLHGPPPRCSATVLREARSQRRALLRRAHATSVRDSARMRLLSTHRLLRARHRRAQCRRWESIVLTRGALVYNLKMVWNALAAVRGAWTSCATLACRTLSVYWALMVGRDCVVAAAAWCVCVCVCVCLPVSSAPCGVVTGTLSRCRCTSGSVCTRAPVHTARGSPARTHDAGSAVRRDVRSGGAARRAPQCHSERGGRCVRC